MADAQDFAEFCRDAQPRLVRALTLHCGDLGVAEQLTQETLAVVWMKWTRVREMAVPLEWTFKVAFNQSNSWFRRQHAEACALRRLRAHPPPHEAAPDDGSEVRQALQAVPARQRTALVLRYYCDLPVDQTARVMGCASGTVKALTHQGIRSLRQALAAPVELGVADG